MESVKWQVQFQVVALPLLIEVRGTMGQAMIMKVYIQYQCDFENSAYQLKLRYLLKGEFVEIKMLYAARII